MFCCMRASVSGLMALLVLWFFPLNIFIQYCFECEIVECQIVADCIRFLSVLTDFYRAMLCIRGTIDMALYLSVSPSVRPCVTSRCSTKTAKRRITQITPHDSPGTLVSDANNLREIRPGSPPTRGPNAGGVGQNRRLLTNSRLYHENGTR